MQLLRERYKTHEGAAKRCRFENAIAKSEFERGYKAAPYHYTIERDQDGSWRVRREQGGK